MSLLSSSSYRSKSKWKLLFYVITTPIQVMLLIKCPLFILRQVSSHALLIQICPGMNMSNISDEMTTGRDYHFTVIVYTCMLIGRWLEALVLHIHLYKYLFRPSSLPINELIQLFRKTLKQHSAMTLVFLILPMLLQIVLTPSLGMISEIKHGRQTSCEVYDFNLVYWNFDFILELHNMLIRFLLYLTAIAIKDIWTKESTKCNGKVIQSEPNDCYDYLEDREVANRDFLTLREDYYRRGNQVQPLLNIFKTWFIIPWILYFVESSL